MLEVIVHAVAFSLLLVFCAGQYGDELFGAQEARRMHRAEGLLQQTVDAIAAYPFEDLGRIDGKQFGDRATTEESEFTVTVEVVTTSNDTLAVAAVLRDQRNRVEISRCVTHRGRADGD